MAQATETKTMAAVADPAPLGLIAFATTTLVLSAANSNFNGVDPVGALPLALFFGGFAQLLAGMWEFKNGNTFGAAAFSSYGAFWLSLWAGAQFYGAAFLATNNIAWYLVGWAIVTAIYLVCTLRLNWGLVVVFALLFITYVLLAIGAFNPVKPPDKPSPIAGYFGIATAIAAYYVALAGLLKSVSKGSINLPLGPIGG